MIELNVKGMSCGHCSSRVESILKELDGVKSCQVDLDQGKAYIEPSKDDGQIREKAVKAINDSEVYSTE